MSLRLVRAIMAVGLLIGCGSKSDRVKSCEQPHSDCAALCNDLCSRLAQCTTPGPQSCQTRCNQAYTCVGETPDQDGTICRNRAEAAAGLSCADLCSQDNFDQVCPP